MSVDVGSNQVSASCQVPSGARALAIGDGAVWLADGEGSQVHA